MRSDPGGLLRQGTDDALIEAASSAIVDLLHASVRRAQLGILQSPRKRLVLPPVPLLVHQQAEPFQKAQLAGGRILLLRLQRLDHSEKAHPRQFFDHRLFKHRRLLTRSTLRRECCRAVVMATTAAECSQELHRASSSGWT